MFDALVETRGVYKVSKSEREAREREERECASDRRERVRREREREGERGRERERERERERGCLNVMDGDPRTSWLVANRAVPSTINTHHFSGSAFSAAQCLCTTSQSELIG